MLSFTKSNTTTPIAYFKSPKSTKSTIIYYDKDDSIPQQLWRHNAVDLSALLSRDTIRNLAGNMVLTGDMINDIYKQIIKPKIRKNVPIQEQALLDRCIEYLEEKTKKEICVLPKVHLLPRLPTPGQENEFRNSMLCAGPANSGKSYTTAQFVKHYVNMFPDNKIILISEVNEDKNYDDVDVFRIELNEDLANNPFTLDELRDSLVIFDDTDTIPNKKIFNEVLSLKNQILQNGRHYNISICITAHQLMAGMKGVIQLNESEFVTVFPECCAGAQIEKYLKGYMSFGTKDIIKLMNLKSRWVTMYKASPNYVVHEHGVYICAKRTL